MIWIVIGNVFISHSFTENKDVINKMNGTNISMDISAEIYYIKNILN